MQGIYSQDFGPYNVSLSVVGHGQDDMVLVGGANSAAVVTQKAYSLVDVRAAFQWNMENSNLLRLSVIGKNLNDKEYLSEALPLGNGGFEGWGTPAHDRRRADVSDVERVVAPKEAGPVAGFFPLFVHFVVEFPVTGVYQVVTGLGWGVGFRRDGERSLGFN